MTRDLDDLLRRAELALAAAQQSRADINSAILKLEFPARPRPINIALGMDAFELVEHGDGDAVILPFRRPR
jgi:hypothetical protein